MSDTQSKRLITWRVDEGLLARIDARAKELGRSRSAFLVWAAENALEDAEGGVPAIAEETPPPARVTPKPKPDAPVDQWHNYALERQRQLNEAKERRR